MIKTIFVFWSGMVAVLDEAGRQMPELQGHYTEVVDRLREHDLTAAEINVAESIFPAGKASPDEFFNLPVRPPDNEPLA
jgi:hypothetical protein